MSFLRTDDQGIKIVDTICLDTQTKLNDKHNKKPISSVGGRKTEMLS